MKKMILTATVAILAAISATADDGGSQFMGKAITNIRMADDGTISFDFMGGDAMAIQEIHQGAETDLWFSLDGRRIQSKPTQRGLYINNGKIAIIK